MDVPKLANDELGRRWLQYVPDEGFPREKGCIATLLSAGDDTAPQIIGTAFVICATGNAALCLGAAHSFEAVKRVERSRTAQGSSNLPHDFRKRGPDYLSSDRIKALVVLNNGPVICDVGHLNYVAGNDVAIFGLHAPNGKEIFSRHFALDFSAPAVGDEVAVLANRISMKAAQDQDASHLCNVEISQHFEMRQGVITQVIMGPSGLPDQSFIFRTTIPTTPGMSGAPVVDIPKDGSPVIVRGVVSSDVSEAAAFDSMLIPGCSAISMLWPAFGLAMPVEIPSGKGGYQFLGDLVQMKLLDNRTKQVTVQVQQDANRTVLLYTDERQQPPLRIQLTRQSHPAVPIGS